MQIIIKQGSYNTSIIFYCYEKVYFCSQITFCIQMYLKLDKQKIVLIAILGVIVLTGLGFYIYSNWKENGKSEQIAYEVLAYNYNVGDYEYFLENFPNSKYRSEVQERLQVLKSMTADWERIENSQQRKDFEEFLEKYSDVYYAQLCIIKVDSLDWIAAQKENTLEAYTNYLAEHKDSRYYAEASIAADQIQRSHINEEDRNSIITLLQDFYGALEKNEHLTLKAYLASTIGNFLGHSNISKDSVVVALDKAFNSQVEKNHFVLGDSFNIVKMPAANGTTNYNVGFSVVRRNSLQEKSYKASAEINSEMRISGLMMETISPNNP